MAKPTSPETPQTPGKAEAEQVWKSFSDVQKSGLGSLSWLGTRWVETMSDIGAEWMNFVADRVREDVKTQHELLHAKDLNEIQRIQADFLQKAMDDYSNETGKMVKFCADTMADIQAKASKKSPN